MTPTLMGDFDVLAVGLIALMLACFLVVYRQAYVWRLEQALMHLMARSPRLTAHDRALIARVARQYGQMGVAAPPTRPMHPHARQHPQRYGRETPRLNATADWDE